MMEQYAEEADAAKIAMIDTEEESKATEARLEFRGRPPWPSGVS